jgi:hypothetical protein
MIAQKASSDFSPNLMVLPISNLSFYKIGRSSKNFLLGQCCIGFFLTEEPNEYVSVTKK